MEKHLERENAGERWALEAQEILSALAVEEAHILSAMLLLSLFVYVAFSFLFPLVGCKWNKREDGVWFLAGFILYEW